MGKWTAPSDFDYQEACGDPVPHQEASGPEPQSHRPCEQCSQTAWFVGEGPDGLRSFMCGQGHLLITAPTATAAQAERTSRCGRFGIPQS